MHSARPAHFFGKMVILPGKEALLWSSAAVQNKTPRKVLKKSTRDSLIAYSFIAPNFIGFCVFTLVPMVFAIALAFCAWDGRHAIEFVGLKNFVKLFTTDKNLFRRL